MYLHRNNFFLCVHWLVGLDLLLLPDSNHALTCCLCMISGFGLVYSPHDDANAFNASAASPFDPVEISGMGERSEPVPRSGIFLESIHILF